MFSLSAPSRLCAFSPLRLLASALLPVSALALLPRPAAAQAGCQYGYYSGPVYSGGHYTNPNNNANSPPNPPVDDGPAGNNNSQWGGHTGTAYGYDTASQHTFSGSSSCYGDLTATFTWTPINNSTAPPPPVIVTETTSSGWSADEASGTGDYANPYKCPTTPSSTGHGISEMGTHYGMKSGAASIPTTASLTASAGGTGSSSAPGGHSVSDFVVYGASVSVVTITLGGTLRDNNGPVLDSSGNQQILVGQQCTATVNGIPTSAGWSATYSWNVSGTTFERWSPTTPQIGTTPANSQASYYNPGPVPAANSTQWYWNDKGPSATPETVKCTVMVTPPAGHGDPFSLTATAPQPVTVYVPGWTAYGVGGYMEVDTSAPGQSGYALFAGPSPTPGQYGGINLTASSMTPPQFGKGSLELVQPVTPQLSYVVCSTGATRNDPENGMYGLDTQYPKKGPSYSEGTYPYFTDDLPSIGLSSSIASATMQHSFTDYLMYQPPGSAQWVPLGTFTWSTNGNATVPFSDNWADYLGFNGSNAAGTVSPSSQTNFTSGNSFPSWTRVNVFPSF